MRDNTHEAAILLKCFNIKTWIPMSDGYNLLWSIHQHLVYAVVVTTIRFFFVIRLSDWRTPEAIHYVAQQAHRKWLGGNVRK